MANKDTVLFDSDTNVYKVVRKDAQGAEKVQDTVDAIEKMDTPQALTVFQGLVGELPNKRRAAVSLACAVLAAYLPDLTIWQGKGDKKTGQLNNELKAQFRKSEDKFFDQFIQPMAVGREAFVARLPKVNERGLPIEADGVENVQARLNYFVSSLRADPNYNNSKNLVLNFFAFVGNLPYDEAKGTIVPPEVMRVMVNNAKDVTPPDTSYKARFTQLVRELLIPDNPEKPVVIKDEHLAGMLQDAHAMVAELERLNRLALQRATVKTKPGDVVTQTNAAIATAGKLEATAPGPGVVKAIEEPAPM